MKGKSGEGGCLQFLPSTWRLFSQEVYGEVKEMTPSRERYVTFKKVEKWLAQGHDAYDIAQLWNTGRAGKCIQGINRHNVPYDSCAYGEKILAVLASN